MFEPDSKSVAGIFDRLLSGEKADADERDLGNIFEFLATRLFSDFPSRNGQYFDGGSVWKAKRAGGERLSFREKCG